MTKEIPAEESLATAVINGDEEKADELEKKAKEGEVIRIM